MKRSQDKPQILLDHHLKALKLPVFLRERQKMAALKSISPLLYEPKAFEALFLSPSGGSLTRNNYPVHPGIFEITIRALGGNRFQTSVASFWNSFLTIRCLGVRSLCFHAGCVRTTIQPIRADNRLQRRHLGYQLAYPFTCIVCDPAKTGQTQARVVLHYVQQGIRVGQKTLHSFARLVYSQMGFHVRCLCRRGGAFMVFAFACSPSFRSGRRPGVHDRFDCSTRRDLIGPDRGNL